MEILILNNEPTQSIKEILFDRETLERYSSLETCLTDRNISVSPKQIKALITIIEEQVFSQLHRFCFLMYVIMEQTRDYGDSGEQQVKISFCRLLLKLQYDEEINQSHVLEFVNQVDRSFKELGLDTILLQDAKKELADFKFQIFGHDFSIHEIQDLGKLLRFIGSTWFLQGGYYGHDVEMILGEGSSSMLREFHVIQMEKELLRTPNTITAMAAIIGDKEIMVRRESLETIFVQKWLMFFSGYQYPEMRIEQQLAEGLKQEAMLRYKVASRDQLDKKKETFIKDMGETILFHEVGHGIIQHHTLSMESGSLGESTKVFGENIVTGLLEFLADLAPQYGGLRGPFCNMATIAQKNQQRASRMFYMYFSDTWFYDTEDTYMYLYSDMLSLVNLFHVNMDKSIDFEKLARSVAYDPENPPEGSLVHWAVDWVHRITEKLIDSAQSYTYKMANKTVSFDEFEAHLDESFKEKYPHIEKGTYKYRTAFWTECLDAIQETPAYTDAINQLLSGYEQPVLQSLYSVFSGDMTEKVAIRPYILDQVKLRALYYRH